MSDTEAPHKNLEYSRPQHFSTSFAGDMAAFELAVLRYVHTKENVLGPDDEYRDISKAPEILRCKEEIDAYMRLAKALAPNNFEEFKVTLQNELSATINNPSISEETKEAYETILNRLHESNDYASFTRSINRLQKYEISSDLLKTGMAYTKERRLKEIDVALGMAITDKHRERLEDERRVWESAKTDLSPEQKEELHALIAAEQKWMDERFNVMHAFNYSILNGDELAASKHETYKLYEDISKSVLDFSQAIKRDSFGERCQSAGWTIYGFFTGEDPHADFYEEKAAEYLGKWPGKLDGRIKFYKDGLNGIESSPGFKYMCRYFFSKAQSEGKADKLGWGLKNANRVGIENKARENGLIRDKDNYTLTGDVLSSVSENIGQRAENIRQKLKELSQIEDAYDFWMERIHEFQEACKEDEYLLYRLSKSEGAEYFLRTIDSLKPVRDEMAEIIRNFEDRLLQKGEAAEVAYNVAQEGVCNIAGGLAAWKVPGKKGKLMVYSGVVVVASVGMEGLSHGMSEWSLTKDGCKKIRDWVSSPEFTEWFNKDIRDDLEGCIYAYTRLSDLYEDRTSKLSMKNFDTALEYALKRSSADQQYIIGFVKLARNLVHMMKQKPEDYDYFLSEYEPQKEYVLKEIKRLNDLKEATTDPNQIEQYDAQLSELGSVAKQMSKIDLALKAAQTGHYFYYAQMWKTPDKLIGNFRENLEDSWRSPRYNKREQNALLALRTAEYAVLASVMEYTNRDIVLSEWQKAGKPRRSIIENVPGGYSEAIYVSPTEEMRLFVDTVQNYQEKEEKRIDATVRGDNAGGGFIAPPGHSHEWKGKDTEKNRMGQSALDEKQEETMKSSVCDTIRKRANSGAESQKQADLKEYDRNGSTLAANAHAVSDKQLVSKNEADVAFEQRNGMEDKC